MNTDYKHFDVVIATPGRDMVAQYVKSLTETIDYFNNEKISYCFINGYSSHVGEAREETFYNFYNRHGNKSTYGKMIWIDSDISWKTKDIARLINSDKEIVSGAYQIFPDVIAANAVAYDHYTKQEIDSLNDYTELFHCGMGFLSVDYGIIESITDPFMPVNYLYENKVFSYFNEDIAFCVKARTQLRKKIWLDPKVKVNHHKIQTLGWD